MKNKLIERLLKLLLFSLIFLQRITIPIGDFQLPIILPIIYIVLLIFISSRCLMVVPFRFWIYFCFVSIGLFFFLIHPLSSLSSLIYLITCYLPFVFVLNNRDSNLRMRLLNVFQKLMIFSALIGILQFITQFIGIPYKDYLNFIPTKFLQTGYNTSYPLSWESSIFKPNSIFFLEPSFLSQFLAVSFIIDVFYFKRIIRPFFYFTALVLTFSGTGLVLLAVALLPIILKQFNWKIIIYLPLVAIFSVWFFNTDYGLITLSRVNEFKTIDSSGYIRFVAPVNAMIDTLSQGNFSLIGRGPGSVDRLILPYITNFTVIPKLFIEYGIIMGSFFMVFISHCFFAKNKMKFLGFSLFIMYTLLSGSLLQPQTVFFVYTLVVLIPDTKYKERLLTPQFF